jgi:hypothetical protein
MGMLELTVKLFIKQQKARDSSNASLLTIGKQGIDFSVDELEFWAKKNYFILNNVYLESAKLEKRNDRSWCFPLYVTVFDINKIKVREGFDCVFDVRNPLDPKDSIDLVGLLGNNLNIFEKEERIFYFIGKF